MGFRSKVLLDSVVSAICCIYEYMCVFIYFSVVCDFLASISKCSSFLVGISICEFLVCFCFGIFHGWCGK